MITWLGSAFEDACLASVQDMHSCDNSVVQHCADPISTTNTVLPNGGSAGSAGWREERPLTRGLPGSSWTVVLRTMTGLEALQHPG